MIEIEVSEIGVLKVVLGSWSAVMLVEFLYASKSTLTCMKPKKLRDQVMLIFCPTEMHHHNQDQMDCLVKQVASG